MNNPVKMYENLNIFVREDGDTPEDQILGLKSNDKVHSLEKYIQELDFADEMWRELYVLNEQLTRRFINVVDIVRTSSSRSICFTKVSGFVPRAPTVNFWAVQVRPWSEEL